MKKVTLWGKVPCFPGALQKPWCYKPQPHMGTEVWHPRTLIYSQVCFSLAPDEGWSKGLTCGRGRVSGSRSITCVDSFVSLEVVLCTSPGNCSRRLGRSKLNCLQGLCVIWLCVRNIRKGPWAHFSGLMFRWAGGHHGEPRHRNWGTANLCQYHPRCTSYSSCRRERWLLPDVLSLIVKI